MMNELTPWEDINPPMVSAPQLGLRSKFSDDETRTIFRNELTACLALTAPVGMTEEARRDWLGVAWESLKDIPADILAHGAKAARLKCDHPSKIVPTIVAETAELMRWREDVMSNDREGDCLSQPIPIPKRRCTGAEASEIVRSLKCFQNRDDTA